MNAPCDFSNLQRGKIIHLIQYYLCLIEEEGGDISVVVTNISLYEGITITYGCMDFYFTSYKLSNFLV